MFFRIALALALIAPIPALIASIPALITTILTSFYTIQCPVGFNSKLLPLPFPTLLLKSPAPILALIATIPFGPALIPSPSKHSFVSLLYSSSILFFLSFLLFLLLDLTPC